MTMAKGNLITHLFLLICLSPTFAQMEDQTRQFFEDGEYFMALENHQEALYNYLRIYKKGINSANLEYRIGQCYINIEGSKHKALPHFIKATKSITLSYKEGSIKETQAPIEAYFYLGVAYQIAHDFDKARDNYRKYLALLPKEDVLSIKFTKQQILACKNASIAVQSENYTYKFEKLDKHINNNASNSYPIVSGNDEKLAFVTNLKFYDALFVSEKSDSSWNYPKNINQQILSDGNYQPCSFSHDGNTILLTKDEIFNSNLYVSHYSDSLKRWSAATKLKSVSSKYWESHASMSKDGKTIFFVSNSKGSYGGMDIFMIEQDDKGKWSKPKNLGKSINTEFNEDAPFITADGKRLYFASQGHDANIGGYDIFYSERIDDSWSKPVGLDYPLNTPDDNKFFCPTGDYSAGYTQIYDTTGAKPNFEIYRVKFN